MTPIKPLFVAAVVAIALPIPALAVEVARSIVLAAPPKTVWDLTRGFCTIDDWHPNVEKCVYNGAGIYQSGGAMVGRPACPEKGLADLPRPRKRSHKVRPLVACLLCNPRDEV